MSYDSKESENYCVVILQLVLQCLRWHVIQKKPFAKAFLFCCIKRKKNYGVQTYFRVQFLVVLCIFNKSVNSPLFYIILMQLLCFYTNFFVYINKSKIRIKLAPQRNQYTFIMKKAQIYLLHSDTFYLQYMIKNVLSKGFVSYMSYHHNSVTFEIFYRKT